VVSNSSGAKLLNLQHINEFEISAPQCPIHYPPARNGDVLDIVVPKNVWLSEVMFSDNLDSDHPPTIFHLLDNVGTRKLLNLVDKFTDWEWFQSLAPELISPRIQMNLEEADKVASHHTASIALAYRPSTSKVTPSVLNKDLWCGGSAKTYVEVKETVTINLGSSL
jgi:hypothetical protein